MRMKLLLVYLYSFLFPVLSASPANRLKRSVIQSYENIFPSVCLLWSPLLHLEVINISLQQDLLLSQLGYLMSLLGNWIWNGSKHDVSYKHRFRTVSSALNHSLYCVIPTFKRSHFIFKVVLSVNEEKELNSTFSHYLFEMFLRNTIINNHNHKP